MNRILIILVLIGSYFFSSCTLLSEKKEVNDNKIEKIIIVDNDIIVDSAQTLIIKSGTEYIFQDTFKIIVRGKLIVEGELDNLVVFRPLDSLAGWGGIVFDNPSGMSSINHAVFKNGRIKGKNVDLRIIGCKFYNNLELGKLDAVVQVYHGSIIIKDCYVKGNDTGEGFLIHQIKGSKPTIVENCEFHGICDAIEYIRVRKNGRIINNRIFSVGQFLGDAIDINGSDSILIEGNTFVNIRDCGIELGNDSSGPSTNIIVKDNVFINCLNGIVTKGGSDAFTTQNIFYKNKVAVRCKFETWRVNKDPNELIVENSIFYGSSESDFVNNSNSTLLISNSCSDKKLDGDSNIIGQAQFIDPDNYNFSLTEDSDCK